MKLTLNPHLSKTNPERCGTQNLLTTLSPRHPPMVVTAPNYIAMGGIVVWDSLPPAFTDAFNGINDNPLLRIGKGWKYGKQIWRIASGGRWGKGGPRLPWHVHIP
jgi:hypothetical protein